MLDTSFFFIRHGQLVEPYLDHLKMDYDTLTKLSLGELDPGINKNAKQLFEDRTRSVDFFQVKTVYYNNSGKSSTRSLESARCIINILRERHGIDVPLAGLPEIREVDFDVSNLLTKEEFNKHGMVSIRTALYKASLFGGAAESVQSIANRIRTVHQVVTKHSKKHESVLFVTHDFFMRFLETYITLPQRLDGLSVNDLDRTTLNSYFCGFCTDDSLRVLDRWGA